MSIESSKTTAFVVMPRVLSAKAGGMTKVVAYFKDGIQALQLPVEVTFCPTRLTILPVLKHVSSIFQLAKFSFAVMSERPDIVHLHVATHGSSTRKSLYQNVAKFFGCKTVLHLHGSNYDEYFRSQSSARKRSLVKFWTTADGVIVLGDGWKKFTHEELGVPVSRIVIINNGAPDPGANARHPGDDVVITFVGTVGERKGVDTLIEAISSLDVTSKCRFVICGNGEVDKFEGFAREKGLSEDLVSFTGWQNGKQIYDHLAKSDIFVLPSRGENQPVAIIEAMAFGLPVISTNVGDIPNQVTSGTTGFIVEPSDSTQLKSALTALIDNTSLRESMGLAARRKFLNEYSVEQNVTKTVDLYQKLAKQKISELGRS